ncbi:hypothetical protein [Lacinutrix salivirga]
MPFLASFIALIGLTSCGSYQYVGQSTDGIYSDSSERIVEQERTVENTNSIYYKNYFEEKASDYEGLEDEEVIFTDIDSYKGNYADTEYSQENYNGHAGWGQDSNEVTINIYDNFGFNNFYWNRPFYGNWGYGWHRPWGWNRWRIGFGFGGHFGYGYAGGFYDPFWGSPYYGINGYYNNPYFGYNGFYRNRAYAYNSTRRGTNRSSIYQSRNRRNTNSVRTNPRIRTNSTRSNIRTRNNSNTIRQNSTIRNPRTRTRVRNNSTPIRTISPTRSNNTRSNSTRMSSPSRSSSVRSSGSTRSSSSRSSSGGRSRGRR